MKLVPLINIKYLTTANSFVLNIAEHENYSANKYENANYANSWHFHIITKTRLYNFDPLKPRFYIVKLGFRGVYIILLIFAQTHRLWVLVRTASPRRFKRIPTIYVLSRNMKNIRVFLFFFISKCSVFLGEI